MESLTVEYPFEIKIPIDSISNSSYRINMTEEGFEIIDFQNDDKKYTFNGTSSYNYNHDLPFEVINFDSKEFTKKIMKVIIYNLVPLIM